MTRIILDKKNIRDYLRRNVLDSLPWKGVDIDNAEVSEIAKNTNVNFLFRVSLATDSGEQSIILKQSREFVKKLPEMSMDPIRNYWEQKAMKAYARYIGKDALPEVFYVDKENHIFVMQDISDDGTRDLVDLFKEGKLDPKTAKQIGEMLGKLHVKTYDKEELVHDYDTHMFVYDLLVWKHKMAGALRFAEEDAKKLIAESDKAKSSLIWTDPATKNIIVAGSGNVYFIDVEYGGLRWDPAFDIGHLLGHYYLIGEEKPELHRDVATCVKECWNAYSQQVSKNPNMWNDLEDLEARAVRYVGATYLHRLKGTKSSRFIFDDSLLQNIKENGKEALSGKYKTFSELSVKS